jgi:hypothetical protein
MEVLRLTGAVAGQSGETTREEVLEYRGGSHPGGE